MKWQDKIKKAESSIEVEYKKLDDKSKILKSDVFKELYSQIKDLPAGERKEYGEAVNAIKISYEQLLNNLEQSGGDDLADGLGKLDITAPFDVNSDFPEFLNPGLGGTKHPISHEKERLLEIFAGMGFEAFESKEIDDEWHMFTSLNFPEDHPARDDYDTFITTEGLVAPAHTSTMQSRILYARKEDLKKGLPIAAVVPDRCFRNEDLDARHEHTFSQIEGVYVAEKVTVGNLIATLQIFLSKYYGKEVETRINPFIFPFTEPSFEFALSCPFCDKKGCHICSQSGWIELLGCGMIHPNVLEMAGVDSKKYSGFAFGCGIERLVMMKYGVEDVRLFNSGKLSFLEQF